MMWMTFADEYDFNRRTRKTFPNGVNKETQVDESSHIITVGDLCFVALGQIVNRNFNATRYQPSGGVVVSSPTQSKTLCGVVRADFGGFTLQKHRAQLLQDFSAPDNEDRRIGAYARLVFYYPSVVEPVVLKQLAVPTFDAIQIEDFVRNTLYPEKSLPNQKRLFDSFVRTHGAASSDGILVELFGDLDTQEADEQGRLSPPLKTKYDARAALVSIVAYPKHVKSQQVPYVNSWEGAERARFIKALVHNKNVKVDAAIYKVFSDIEDDDYLALACMNCLIDKGHDEEIRGYCERRIGKDKYQTEELRQMLARFGQTKM